MKEALTISTYQPFTSNTWVVAAIIDSHLITRTYYGFTKREAIRNTQPGGQDEGHIV